MSFVEHRTHNGGLDGLSKRMFELEQRRVRVGYIKGKSAPQFEEAKGDQPPLTCAQVAAWNTYGTLNKDGSQHIPERPFMQEGLKRGKRDMARLNRINLILILRGQMSVNQALGQLGALATGWIKRAIAESKSWAVPNAWRTIQKKTRAGKVGDQPLKDSGSMEQATTWSVN